MQYLMSEFPSNIVIVYSLSFSLDNHKTKSWKYFQRTWKKTTSIVRKSFRI